MSLIFSSSHSMYSSSRCSSAYCLPHAIKSQSSNSSFCSSSIPSNSSSLYASISSSSSIDSTKSFNSSSSSFLSATMSCIISPSKSYAFSYIHSLYASLIVSTLPLPSWSLINSSMSYQLYSYNQSPSSLPLSITSWNTVSASNPHLIGLLSACCAIFFLLKFISNICSGPCSRNLNLRTSFFILVFSLASLFLLCFLMLKEDAVDLLNLESLLAFKTCTSSSGSTS